MSDYFKIKGYLYGLIEYESCEEHKLDTLTDIFLGTRNELIKSVTEEIRGELSTGPSEVQGQEKSDSMETRQERPEINGVLHEKSSNENFEEVY